MSNFTRREIKKSFLKLLAEKPLSQITVKDIVNDCGISRGSFYYHYQDTNNLISEIIKEKADIIISEYSDISQFEDTITYIIDKLLDKSQTVLNIYNCISHQIISKEISRLCNYFAGEIVEKSFSEAGAAQSTKESMICYFECLFTGFIAKWIENGLSKEYADRFRSTVILQLSGMNTNT